MDINAKNTEKRLEKAISNFGRFLRAFPKRLKRLVKWCFATLPRRIVSSILIILLVLLPVSNLLFTQEAKASWWDERWLYRQEIPISYAGNEYLTEYQVLIDNLDTASFISNGKMKSDCSDMRFADYGGTALDYSIVGDTCNTSETKVWVKTTSIPASDIVIYLYYGNPSASAVQSESKTFSYVEEKTIGYVLHDSVLDLQVMSLAAENSISHNGTTLLLGEYDTGSFTSIDQWGAITAKRLFNADDNAGDRDLFVPVSWAGTEFYFQSRSTSTDSYFMVAPWEDSAVTIYDNGVDTSCGATITDSGSRVNCSTGEDSVIRVSATKPILLFADPAGISDPMPVHPATDQKWLGGGSGSYIANGNAVLDYRYTNNVSSSDELNPSDATANSRPNLGGDSSYGGGGLLVWSADSHTDYGVYQLADGDGSDAHFYNDETEQGTVFGSANQADYISVASTQDATCSVYEADGTQIASQQLTSSNTSVYHYGFGTGDSDTYTSGAWYMECDRPVVAHYQKAIDSESNLMHYPMMRQFTYPTPTVGAIEAEEIGPGPVAYWNFDEGYGTTAHDSSGQGNDGTLTNMSASSDPDSGWQTEGCVSGKCLVFDGSDDYVIVGHDGRLMFNDGDFTVGIWAKPFSMSGYTGLITTDTSGDSAWKIFRDIGDNYFRARYGDLELDYPSVSENEWHYYSLSKSGTMLTLYLDGRRVNSGICPETHPLAGSEIVLGSYRVQNAKDGLYIYEGFIDEVKIYPYARSAEEIAQDYNAGLAGMGTSGGSAIAMGGGSDAWMSDGLVGYWKMDESSWNGTSGEVTDWSGNGHDGTGARGVTTSVGKYGNGGDFDGIDDYARIDEVIVSDPSALTISSWIRKDGSGGTYECALHHGTTNTIGSSSYWLGMQDSTDYIVATIGANTGVGWAAGQTSIKAETGEWNHVTASWDGNIVRVYVNGEYVKEYALASYSTLATPTRFGAANAGTTYQFNGAVDEARIYTRALSPDEVRDLYEYAPGPVGHWTFDESEGATAYDSSGNGNDGTLTNGPTWTNGKVGGALEFDGSNDYVDVGTGTSLSFTDNFTLSSWIHPTDYHTTGYYGLKNGIFARGPATTYNYGLQATSATTISFVKRTNSQGLQYYNFTGIPSLTDKWTHVSATVSDGTVSLYLDGVLYDSKSVGTITGYAGDTLKLGSMTIGQLEETTFIGKLDDMRIYDYARTQEQIIEDMNAGSPVISSGAGSAGAYWNFDEGYGTSAHDAWGDNTGTINGATWTNDGRFGKALSFDGSDDYVQIADDDALTFGDGTSDRPFSISSWVNMDDRSQFLISSKASEYRLTNNNHFRLYLYDGNTSNSIYKSGGDLVSHEGRWTHLVATYDGSGSVDGIRLYKDGMLIVDTEEASAGTYVAMENTTSSFRLGDTTTDGQIDEVKIYPYALSEDEVRTEYNRGSSVGMAVSGPLSIGGSSSGAHAEYCPPGNTEGNCASGQDPSPVGEWKFDEGTGTTAQDTSGNNNTGTWNGTGSHWGTGKFGKAGRFNGINDYVDLGSGSNFNWGTGDFTIGFWLGPHTDNNGWSWLVEKNSGAPGLVIATLGNRIRISFGAWFTDVVTDPGKWDISTSSWNHIEVIRKSGMVYTYVNGLLYGTPVASSYDFSAIASSPLVLGVLSPSSSTWQWLNGSLDQFRVYSYARTPAQIAWDYNRGKPIAHWKMDECEGGTIHDSSGNGLHGTWSGSGGSQTSVGNCQSSGTAWGNGADGKFGSSLSFDGTDDRIDVGDVGSVSDWSISYWMHSSALENYRNILHTHFTGSANNQGVRFEQYGGGTFKIGVSADNTWRPYSIVSDLGSGKWYHVVATGEKSSDRLRVYLNGVKELDTNHTSWPSSFPDVSVGVGFSTSSERWFNGKIDDVQIYNYTLSDQQIKLLYNGGASLRFGE